MNAPSAMVPNIMRKMVRTRPTRLAGEMSPKPTVAMVTKE